MRKLVVLVALVTAVACDLGTDTGTGPLVGSLEGTYALQSMNGSALPFAIVAHDTTVFIDQDVLILDGVGNWSEKVNFRQTVGAAAATSDSFQLAGIWTRSANSLSFRTSQGLLYVGTATDTTLHLADAGYTYVFRR
jgi:hypothetical protein